MGYGIAPPGCSKPVASMRLKLCWILSAKLLTEYEANRRPGEYYPLIVLTRRVIFT
jgi:hypothetical protein